MNTPNKNSEKYSVQNIDPSKKIIPKRQIDLDFISSTSILEGPAAIAQDRPNFVLKTPETTEKRKL